MKLRELTALVLAAMAISRARGADPPASDVRAALERVRTAETQRIGTFAKAARAVVCIFDDEKRGGGGSGVIFSPDGFGLTNVHVVSSFLDTRKGFGGLADGNLYELQVIGIDPGGDIALFRLLGKAEFDAAPLGNSDDLVLGQRVAAMGNPFLLADDYTPTITLGVVSGLHRYQEGQNNFLEYADCIQVSTSINPGNSGGPLFDLDGHVIGINGRASFEERGRVNVGVGYAVTVNQIRRFLPGLMGGRLVEHGTLGATIQEEDGHLRFNAVEDAAAGDRAGLQLDDVLLTFNGRAVHTPNEFNNVLALLPMDWPVSIGVRRGDKELLLRTRLDRLPIRQERPWLIDWKQNYAYGRRIFDRFRENAALKNEQNASLARGVLTTRSEGADAAQPFELRWRDGVLDSIRIGSADRRIADIGLGGARAREPAAQLAILGQGLTALLRPGGVGWEVRGGDEVAGRIAIVTEAKPEALGGGAATTMRWKFDADTSELLAIARVADALNETDAWTALHNAATPTGAVMTWRNADNVQATIDQIEYEPAPAADAKEPQ